jgi:signal recognition particle subunit SEC65
MSDEQDKKDPPEIAWEKREFVINEKMKEICRLGIKATEAEIKGLLRKLEKLQYGGR